jgi:hypothetical protein
MCQPVIEEDTTNQGDIHQCLDEKVMEERREAYPEARKKTADDGCSVGDGDEVGREGSKAVLLAVDGKVVELDVEGRGHS